MAGRAAVDQFGIEAAVRAAIEHHGLLPESGRVVVGVSGGADSLCLLGVLDRLCGPDGPWPAVELVVAHLDHGLRGAAGRADAEWVAQHAASLGLPARLGRADVGALARTAGRGLEDAARRARYAFLREVARAEGASRICVGHTRDDQVETLVMRWLRGSGLDGLLGMQPLAGDVARPLLTLAREQTHAYCAARGWIPREDPSNQDRRYLRNRVRHDLLPALRRYNPGLDTTLPRNAELLADDARYLDERAGEAWQEVARAASAERVDLDAAGLARLPPSLRRRVLRRAAAYLAGGEPALEARHVALLEALAAAGGGALSLPHGLAARAEDGVLALGRRDAARDAAGEGPTDASVPLPVPGCATLPGGEWRVCAELLDPAAGAPPPGSEGPRRPADPDPTAPPGARAGSDAAMGRALARAYLDADAAGEPLTLRAWRPGDRFRPLGMTGEKKVQDYFVDAKVPRALRARIPLVWGPRHLLWIAGHRLDDRVQLGPTTRRVLALRIEPAGAAGTGRPDAGADAETRRM